MILLLAPARFVNLTEQLRPRNNEMKIGRATMPPLLKVTMPCGAVRAGETCGHGNDGRPNGPEVNPRGQGPRGYGSAAHGLPACESRDAGRAPPCRF